MLDARFIDRVYEAAFDPDLWQRILDDLAHGTNAIGTMLHGVRDLTHKSIFSESLRAFMNISSQWGEANIRGKLLLTLPSNQFHSDADYFTDEQMKADWLYRDLLWPHGLGYAAATYVKIPNGDTLILSVERPYANGPFERSAVERLTALRPHLARSAMLASRLEFERIRGANQALQMTGLPSAAIDGDGKVIDGNALFLSTLAEQVVITAGDRLRLINPQANKVLEECLERARSTRLPKPFAGRSVVLPRTASAPAAVFHVVPVRGSARDLFSRAAFFVLVTPHDATKLASVEIIQGLFDLTASEARIAGAIALGKDVHVIAAEFAISPDTVRYHLKRIFAKTGFTRQSELAASIASIRTFS